MNINLNHLRTFFFCGKHRTFSEAAEALFLSTPAVTMQMKQLEASLGIDLFLRHRNSIALTDTGLMILEYARKIFELAEAVENTIEEIKALKIGDLRVGTLRIYAGYIMPSLIASYQEKYPGVHVLLDEGGATEIARSIIENKNELGLIPATDPVHPQLQLTPCFQEELVLILPRGHHLCQKREICIADLAREPLLLRQRGTSSREFIFEKFREAGIETHIITETKNVPFIIEQVQAGKGITLMPKSPLKELIKYRPLEVRSLAEDPILININIVYLKNRVLSPAAQAFMELLLENRHNPNGGIVHQKIGID